MQSAEVKLLLIAFGPAGRSVEHEALSDVSWGDGRLHIIARPQPGVSLADYQGAKSLALHVETTDGRVIVVGDGAVLGDALSDFRSVSLTVAGKVTCVSAPS